MREESGPGTGVTPCSLCPIASQISSLLWTCTSPESIKAKAENSKGGKLRVCVILDNEGGDTLLYISALKLYKLYAKLLTDLY